MKAPIHKRGGFTLIELLVVVGVIAILISILVPVVGRVRTAARETDTRNEILQIQLACETYHRDFHAFPGWFSNTDVEKVASGTPVAGVFVRSGTENLVISLLGGINASTGAFDPTLVGKGPLVLDANGQIVKRSDPYGDNLVQYLYKGTGLFTDDSGNSAGDTNVPEFIDRFSNPLPILYLRARVGADSNDGMPSNANVISYVAGSKLQYCELEYRAYTSQNIGGKVHGLRQGTTAGTIATNEYFRVAGQEPSVPRCKDYFILISAGADGIYGTTDDICISNFGKPGE